MKIGHFIALLVILVVCLTQASASFDVAKHFSEKRTRIHHANQANRKLGQRMIKQGGTFTNPVFADCPDPAVYSDFVNKYYYLTCTRQDYVWVFRSKDPTQWSEGDHTVVFTKSTDPNSLLNTELWAPEIHYAFDQWVVYFTSRNAFDPDSHRIFVSTNPAQDPFSGTWSAPKQVTIARDPWAIDPSIFTTHGQYYFLYTGYTTPNQPESGSGIYITTLSDPTTTSSAVPTIISAPTFLFSKFEGDNDTTAAVNEGPHFWSHDDIQFITFSGSDCSSDNYALGLLYRDIQDDPTDGPWPKYPDPVLYKNTTGSVYATGHNGFFKDVNGCNDWIVFHANDAPNLGCGQQRAAHIQPFGYNATNGLPSFGGPAQGLDEQIPKPGTFS